MNAGLRSFFCSAPAEQGAPVSHPASFSFKPPSVIQQMTTFNEIYVFVHFHLKLYLSYQTLSSCFQNQTPIREIPQMTENFDIIQGQASLTYEKAQTRQAHLECCPDPQGSWSRRIFLSAPEQHFDDLVGNESHQSLPQSQQQALLDSLPDFQNSIPISSDIRDENGGSLADQPCRSQQQARSNKQTSQLAEKVLQKVYMRRAPEERASDFGGNHGSDSAFLDSVPARPRSPQRRRGAFARTIPAEGRSNVSLPNPECDPLMILHPDSEDALSRFGLLPRSQGQRVPWNPDLVFPDPIMMDQSGDKLH